MNYYVYYRLDPARADVVRDAVLAMFAQVEAKFGVRGRWMRRRDDPGTFMEVYEGVGDEQAFEAFLQRESAPLGLERRTERFVSA